MKRFVVAFPEATKEDEATFIAQLDQVEWWHHMPGVWLLADPSSRLTSGGIRDSISHINPSIDILVVEVGTPISYSSRLDHDVTEKSHEWIGKYWHKGNVPDSDR